MQVLRAIPRAAGLRQEGRRRGRWRVGAVLPVSSAAALVVAATLWMLAPATAAAGEQTLSARDIRQNLFGACFVSPTEGWVVGDLGRVLRTSDGGRTWIKQEVAAREPFLSVSCTDGQHAWLSSRHGRIYRTSDGGGTWAVATAPVDRNLFKVVFSTPSRGTAVGDFGVIVHSEDGGATWERISLPDDFKLPDSVLDTGVDPGDAILYGLSFADADHGWIAGEFGTLLATTDGGRSWRQLPSGLESTLFGIGFADAQHGIAVGIDGVILATEDGGQSWKRLPAPFAERSYYDVAISGKYGWIVGGQGTLLRSSDGGRTWQAQSVPIKYAADWFRGLSLVGDRGFLVGGSGLIYTTAGDSAVLLRDAQSERRS